MSNPNLTLKLGDYSAVAILSARRLTNGDEDDFADRVSAALVAGAETLGTGDPLMVVKAMRNGAATGKVAQQISVPTVSASSLCQEGEDGEMESEDECLERVGLDEVLLQVMDDLDEPDALGLAEEHLDELRLRLDLAAHNRLTSAEVDKLSKYLRGRIAHDEAAIAEYHKAAFMLRGDVENPEPQYPFVLDRNSDEARARYKTQVETGLAGPIEWLSDPMDLCGVDEFEHDDDVQARDKEVVAGDFLLLPDGKFKYLPSINVHRITTSEGHESHVHLDYRHERLPIKWIPGWAFSAVEKTWGKSTFPEQLRRIVRKSRLDDEQNLAELLKMLGTHLVNVQRIKIATFVLAVHANWKNEAVLGKLLKGLDKYLEGPVLESLDEFYDAALPALGLDWSNAYLESADWGEGIAIDANDAGLGDVSDILWPDPDPASDEYTIPEMEWGSVDLAPLLAKIKSFGPARWQSAVWMKAFIPVFANGARFEEANAAGRAAWMKANHFTPKPVGVRPVVSLGAYIPPSKNMFAGYTV